MRINKITKLKNNKYKIHLDEEIILTFDNVILENNLLYKKQIDKELYDKIIKDTEYYNSYNKVVNYILKKKRSEKEIKEYLIKFDLNESDKEKLILKLKNNNLINDFDYCRSYINDNLYLSKNGIAKIRKELLKQNIPNEIIDQELSKVDSDFIKNKLEKLILKKIKLNKKYSNNYLKEKILIEMLNLGYNKSDIISILNSNMDADNMILKKEFEKNYNKLSKKYSGNELINNIKNKMMMKGFNISDINELIDKKKEK